MNKTYHKQKSKAHYQKYKASYQARAKTQQEERRAVINEAKQAGCTFCSEKEPTCMDFHHRDPSQKDFTIADNRVMNLERLQSELAKCVLVCSNCHRKIHAGLIQF